MNLRNIGDLSQRLLQAGPTPAAVAASLPLSEMPMRLTLDQLRPNPDNPRHSPNPKYQEIKASIRERGLDSVPKVTRDPHAEDELFIFSDGGNTRYAILCELWQETADRRFYHIPCLFKPWPGRAQCLIGHLAENELRGDLTFIEKARAVEQLRQIFVQQLGRELSQRELAELLKQSGYPVHHSNISRMAYTMQSLYPYLPTLLNSGLGRPQVMRLMAIERDARQWWQQHGGALAQQPFSQLFAAVCQQVDAPDRYQAAAFRQALFQALHQACPQPLSVAAEAPVLSTDSPTAPDDPPPEASALQFAAQGLEPVSDIWHIPLLLDDIEHLQGMAFRLAFELSEVLAPALRLTESASRSSAGYCLDSPARDCPLGQLLSTLAGDHGGLPDATLSSLLLGDAQQLSPMLDDLGSVKLLRLIRVLRRLRALQRQEACR